MLKLDIGITSKFVFANATLNFFLCLNIRSANMIEEGFHGC